MDDILGGEGVGGLALAVHVLRVGLDHRWTIGSNLKPAPIWSQLQFDSCSFDSSKRLLEILRWSFSSDWILKICEIELQLGLALVLWNCLNFEDGSI